VLALTPGVDTLLVLRTAAVDGWRTAGLAVAGIALGCLLWAAAVSAGLGAVLAAAPAVLQWLQWAGAGYLLWLGAGLLLRPRDGRSIRITAPDAAGAFRRGLMTNLLNPKMGIFYLTFLPQFIPAGGSIARWSFALALAHILVATLWFAVLIAASGRLGAALRRPGTARAIDRVAGSVFVALGLRLGLEQG
jgi:threonine/homoserine/homoserine lactone efflux protein